MNFIMKIGYNQWQTDFRENKLIKGMQNKYR